MRFKTKVDWFYKSIILFLLAVFLVGEVSIYQNENTLEAIIFGLIFLLIISFLIAAIFTTHFTFESDHLLCKYSFWKIKIQYANIKKIERHEVEKGKGKLESEIFLNVFSFQEEYLLHKIREKS